MLGSEFGIKKKHKHETWLNPPLEKFKLVLVVWGIIIFIFLHIFWALSVI